CGPLWSHRSGKDRTIWLWPHGLSQRDLLQPLSQPALRESEGAGMSDIHQPGRGISSSVSNGERLWRDGRKHTWITDAIQNLRGTLCRLIRTFYLSSHAPSARATSV